MSKTKQSTVGKLKLPSPTSNISGVKLLKSFAPSIRRRRQCDKEKLEIYNLEENENQFSNNVWDAISPITPPAAFKSAPLGKKHKTLNIIHKVMKETPKSSKLLSNE
ncbi:hypothetical protein PVAND_007616 [Polypedilum vanderplanki]|uniref:Uncharacterized protein n=1 Tax=Polypedilum vanderplanki TaxID=319348 RepID=A0A9J6C6V5_POLVA|nr:hypothetical protein PVAND_007616 [Polypedilum vanderplanki]